MLLVLFFFRMICFIFGRLRNVGNTDAPGNAACSRVFLLILDHFS